MTSIISNNYIIPNINKFLTIKDLVITSSVNNIMYIETKKDLLDRKKEMIDELLYYFYWMDINNCISLYRRYSSNYKVNVRKLFLILPELFEFIEYHNITSLDFSCITSYGGYPECPHNFIDSKKLTNIIDQLILLIKNNTTLTYCNIGLFENFIDRDKLITHVSLHPKLECISIHSNGATTYFNKPPTSLYRTKDNKFVWAHFKPLDNI